MHYIFFAIWKTILSDICTGTVCILLMVLLWSDVSLALDLLHNSIIIDLFIWFGRSAIVTIQYEHPYNLRHNGELLQPLVNSIRCWIERISYLGPKIWGMVYIVYIVSKKVIKKWKPENCPCKICIAFVKNIEFCEITWIFMF